MRVLLFKTLVMLTKQNIEVDKVIDAFPFDKALAYLILIGFKFVDSEGNKITPTIEVLKSHTCLLLDSVQAHKSPFHYLQSGMFTAIKNEQGITLAFSPLTVSSW